MPNETSRFRTRIFDVLREHGVSRSWFADQMGIDRTLLYRIEWGERPMPDGYISRAATILRVEENMLIPLPSEVSERHDSVSTHQAAVPA